jgi:hypothetical protein
MGVLENLLKKTTPLAKCKEITVAFTPGQYYSGDQRKMRWTRHVTRFSQEEGWRTLGFVGKPKRRDHLEDLDVYRSIILK